MMNFQIAQNDVIATKPRTLFDGKAGGADYTYFRTVGQWSANKHIGGACIFIEAGCRDGDGAITPRVLAEVFANIEQGFDIQQGKYLYLDRTGVAVTLRRVVCCNSNFERVGFSVHITISVTDVIPF